MRLIDIKQCINIEFDNLDFKVSEIGGGNSKRYGVQKFRIVLLQLSKAGFVRREDFKFYDDIVNAVNTDSLTYPSSNYIGDYIVKISYLVKLLHYWINEFLPVEQDDETVNIKLPKINNFDVLNKVANELRLAFSSVISEYEGGKIEIVQFDHGSFWCVIKVGTALLLFTGLAWAGAVVAKKTIECRSAYEVYRNASARNEMLEELKRLNKAQIDIVVTQEAKLIQQEHFNKEDHEQLERIKNSILNISELILKGTEIQPAIAAPEDVKNLFPDFSCLPLIESRTKKLTENIENNQ